MDDTNNYSRTELQRQTAEWLLREECNAMVTLTFSGEKGVSYQFAEKAFGSFTHKLKCRLFGRNSKKRIRMCPIVEDFGGEQMWSTSAQGVRRGTHIHCLMRLPGDPMDYKEVVRNLWCSSGELCGDPNVNCPNSSDWFVDISNEQDRREVTHYVLKKCAQDIDGVLVKFMPTRSAI
jgi:hypothetical protein